MVRTGYYFAALPLLAGGLLVWLGWWGPAVFFLVVGGFVLYFFRDPRRSVPAGPGIIVSPADGRVLSVDQLNSNQAGQTRISIFLSVFDVHVNRAPIAGRITSVEYRPGRFHVASRDAASRENEHNEVIIEGEGTRVAFRQIAGVVARRIEFWKKQGDSLERGERVGMIRFGSRTEVFIQPHYRVQVRPGDHVQGGSSVLATRE